MGIKLRNLLQKDLDEVFSYASNVQVYLKSPTLSLITLVGQLFVIFLFFYQVNLGLIQNFIAKTNFYDFQVTKGFANVRAVGTGVNPRGANVSVGEVWDQYDNCVINENQIFVGLKFSSQIS